MKLKHIIVLALSIALSGVSPAQELITKTPAVKRAEAAAQATAETIGFVESRLKQFYAAATVDGEEQEFFDTFGTNAAAAIQLYTAWRETVLAARPTADIPAVDSGVFVSNPDGTVTYVAPPDPEPEE